MMRRQWVEGLMMAAGLLLGAGTRGGAAETWIDLTHPFNADTIFWPTEKGFQFDPRAITTPPIVSRRLSMGGRISTPRGIFPQRGRPPTRSRSIGSSATPSSST